MSKQITVHAPFNGQVLALEEAPDEVFSSGMMGHGFVLQPEQDPQSGICVSPCDGELVTLMAHAFVVRQDEKAVLVHCGIDTVHLGDEWSKMISQLGAQVSMGEQILQLDWAQVAHSEHSEATPIVGVEATRFEFAPACQSGSRVKAGEVIGTLYWD